MPSADFLNLEACIRELKRIYLDDALGSSAPTVDQQELARAFVVLAHAEFEFFIENVLSNYAQLITTEASKGQFNASSLSLLAFSGLDPLVGGDSFSGTAKGRRKLETRFGEAFAKYRKAITENHGVKEKYLAALAIPIGLHGGIVDAVWLGDLETFCVYRGAFGHKSRTFPEANPLGVNPLDIWHKCAALIWANPAMTTPGSIGTFQHLDDWVQAEKQTFRGTVTGIRLTQPGSLWRRLCALIIGRSQR